MTVARTGRLGGYAALAAAALLTALVLRRPELVVVAAPFLLWLAAGLLVAQTPSVTVTADLDRDRAVEGDQVELTLHLRATITVDRLELHLLLPAEVPPAHPGGGPVVLRLQADQERVIRVRLRCGRWGGYLLGQGLLRAHDRFGLLVWDRPLDAALPLKVYPRPERLRALARPPQTQRLVGDQLARQVGAGVEFAELRPFVPGDQVRHVNWPASARRGQLLVTQRHPERTTDVVLFLDTYAEARDPHGSSTLDLTVRAAAALANRYLGSKDRVGLILYGGYLQWLYPASGRTQAWRILDLLLDTQIAHSVAERPIQLIPLRMLPPGALILAVTPLLDERATRALLQLRARGFGLAILALSPAAYIRPAGGETGDLAYRLWLLQRDANKWRYQRLGVPVAEWHHDQPLEAPIAELRTFQRRAHRVRA